MAKRKKTLVRASNMFSYYACDQAVVTNTGKDIKFVKDGKTYTRKAWVAGYNTTFVYVNGTYLKLSNGGEELPHVIDEYVEKKSW